MFSRAGPGARGPAGGALFQFGQFRTSVNVNAPSSVATGSATQRSAISGAGRGAWLCKNQIRATPTLQLLSDGQACALLLLGCYFVCISYKRTRWPPSLAQIQHQPPRLEIRQLNTTHSLTTPTSPPRNHH